MIILSFPHGNRISLPTIFTGLFKYFCKQFISKSIYKCLKIYLTTHFRSNSSPKLMNAGSRAAKAITRINVLPLLRFLLIQA